VLLGSWCRVYFDGLVTHFRWEYTEDIFRSGSLLEGDICKAKKKWWGKMRMELVRNGSEERKCRVCSACQSSQLNGMCLLYVSVGEHLTRCRHLCNAYFLLSFYLGLFYFTYPILCFSLYFQS
jgi:hypothetical protein